MFTGPATVTRAVRLRILAGTGDALPLDAELRYSVADPFAVETLFDTGDSEPVRWVFARDLLSAGLVGSAGDGDVAVASARDDRGERVVHIRLSSPDGLAVLEAPAVALSAFLATTYGLVPAGTESDHLDIDAALEALLRA